MTTQRIGKYEVQEQIGKSVRAAVYRGIDTDTKGSVAIKVIPREHVDAAALANFAKSAQALRTLVHPGIARLLEVVESSSKVALVSAAAQGEPLTTLLKDGAYPDGMTTWEIVRQLLEMLAVAHVHGAIHRDLKASNVLVAPSGHVTLVDFGTSALYSVNPESVEHYAPEHFGEGKVGPRGDIYQAGVLVYRLVCGKVPFTGSFDEIRHRVMEERPTDPSTYNNKLAWQLDWVLQKALAKEPVERFASALEFGDGLRLGLQDTVARPLEPVKINAPKPAAAAAAAPAGPKPVAAGATAQVLQNARALAARDSPAKALAQSATTAPAAAKAPAAPAAAAAAPTAPRIDPAKPTVLFVDDDARILNGLKVLFRQDYNALTVESGAAALEILKRTPVHVIVSDQRMPNMTGVELLRKSRELMPNAVRILLTGYTDLASLVGSINQGEIFRFVKKPWENEELRQALVDATKIALELTASPLPTPKSPRTAGSLLVIEPTQTLARGLERLLAGTAGVRTATTVQEAAKIIGKEEIAAVVADMSTGMDGLALLFKELRAKRPQVLSILLTDEPDSEVAIELINNSQIFRFLPKPVSARELRTQVADALRRYSVHKQSAGSAPVQAAQAGAAGRPVARPA